MLRKAGGGEAGPAVPTARQRPLPILAALALAGCASYAPAPLPPPAAVLAAPDLAVLSADAARIDRPLLAPQPIDLAAPLSPEALSVLAVVASPDLKALRAKTGVADAQAFAARLLPDPTGSIGFDKLLAGPDAYNGFAGQLAFDLNQLRLAKVVRAGGTASRRQVRLDLAWAEWQAAGQARLLGARILALAAQFELARASAASASRVFDAVLRAAGRGDLGATDLDVRRQAMLDAGEKARIAERDLGGARSELDKLLGLPPETVLRLAPAAPPPPPPAVAPLVAQAIERRLDLAALRAGYASAEADVHKAVLEQFPALSLTVAGARDTARNYTLGPQVGFTLPLWNRNRGGIAVAAATRAQLRAEYEARLIQTRAEIDIAAGALGTIAGQRAALAAQLPALARFAEASGRAARRGDLARATAEAAGQSLRDRRLALLALDQQAAEQTIALELLTGSLAREWTR